MEVRPSRLPRRPAQAPRPLEVANKTLLPAFVENCLADNVSHIAVMRAVYAQIEDEIEGLIVGDGSDDARFITTSNHPYEALDEVVDFASMW